MRVKIATIVLSAAALAVAALSTAGAPAAQAASPAAVAPGDYRLVANVDPPRRACLRGEGGTNDQAEVGDCGITWTLSPAGGARYAITHAATGQCLDTARELIHPPMAATLPYQPCPLWVVAPAEAGRVTLSLGRRGDGYLTAVGRDRPAVLLGHSTEFADRQQWTLVRA